jgi:carbonic anhydrase
VDSPSEEKLNGKAYDMVVHLVHEDQDGDLKDKGISPYVSMDGLDRG